MLPLTKLVVVILASLLASLCEAQLTQNERQKFLDKHNEVRKNVSPTATKMKKMKWSHDLETMSQIWAEGCKFDHGNPTCTNKPHSYIGQNLYLTSAKTYDPDNVVTAWANEVNDYTFNTNACASGKQCGHYTQVVWSSSNEVGCGAKYCDGTGYLVVCNYGPAGNYVGSKPYTSGTSCSACASGNTCVDNMCVDSAVTYTIPSSAPSTTMVCEGGSSNSGSGGSGSGSGSTIVTPATLLNGLTVMFLAWKNF